MPIRGDTFVEPFSATMTRTFKIKRPIFSKATRYQQVEVVETYDYGVTLFIDSRFQTSEKDEFFYHESLVHPAMMTHPCPRRVLVIGGGDGGVIEEVEKYPSVERIVMVELDREVVDICREHLTIICGKAFEDPRLELVIGDGRTFVEETKETFDIIILDLTDPTEPAKYVYTKEFYELCGNILAPGGLLAMHQDSPFFFTEVFNVISKTLAAAFSHSEVYLTFILGYMFDWSFSISSKSPVPRLSAEELKARLIERNIWGLQFYSPEMHEKLFALPGYVTRILETPCAVSTDANPYVMEDFEV